MQTANDIRKVFLDFFGKNDHKIVQSSPLVPPARTHFCEVVARE